MAAEPSPTGAIPGVVRTKHIASENQPKDPLVVTSTQSNELAAGVVVVRWFENTPRFLLLRVYAYWEFPKGRVEPGEQPIETAVREAREEAALDDLEFLWGYEYRETPPYRRGKIARYYLARSGRARVQLLPSPALGRPEHHAYAWLSFDEAHELLVERLKTILEWAHDTIGHRSSNETDA